MGAGKPVARERVSLREGKNPLIFIAPHGYCGDDTYTAKIALEAAREAKGFAVVNNGWERADVVDAIAGKANCNNINHLSQEVVCEEFFEPILRFQARCNRRWGETTIFIVHGLGAVSCQSLPEVDVVLGFGDGKPPSFTMELEDRIKLPRVFHDFGLNPYIGMAGGKYSGWARPNLNQYFRKWVMDDSVRSVQVEVAHQHRTGAAAAYLFGDILAGVALQFLKDESPQSRNTRFPEA